jgi:N-acetylneuraminic acid mutarotase
MIVWGGYISSTGGRYNPNTYSWVATADFGTAPSARDSHTAVWTGSEMIVWGGSGNSVLNTGARYTPSTDSWVAINTTSGPSARDSHTAVWTGIEMIVWGGWDGSNPINSGGKYNPATDGWVPTSLNGAPDSRYGQSAVWTGKEMIIWGGSNGSNLNSGGRYNPNTDGWVAITNDAAPNSRSGHTAVWTGGEMIVWGGDTDLIQATNSGGRYNPSSDTWTATTTVNAPSQRDSHTAVWTGSEMIVWGGNDPSVFPPLGLLSDGGRYNPSTDSWIATNPANGPSVRHSHTAIWTGSEMIVWGGESRTFTPPFVYALQNTGGIYDPSADSWGTTNVTGAPGSRKGHTAVWTGNEMIVWGGDQDSGPSTTGGRYCARPAIAQLGNISTRLAVGTGDNALIGGFIITGTQPKRVIVRALGPSLPVPDVLADPVLELHQGDGEVITNDNWRDSQEAEIIASGFAPTDDAESAIIATLPPGGHTAIVRGTNDTTGVALVEVYDLDSTSASTMANVSTRGFVQTGDNVLIGGTIISGGGSANILVRAIGPSLSNSGVPNVLEDPTLELHDGNGTLLAANDNWRDTQEAAIQATGLAPTNDLESAILRNLPPAAYTAIVRGANDTTGIGLVELYALP